MNLERTSFDNISEYLEYLFKTLYINHIGMSFEFTNITIKNSVMNFHVYVIPKGFTFKTNEEVNSVMSRCTSNDTYTQVIIGYNIKIDSGVTLTPPKRCKGLIIYDKGMLSNFGSISMYARGCIAIGQDIYLTFTEYVPAFGASGGTIPTGIDSTYWCYYYGPNGSNGINRQSGGGATGALYAYSAHITSAGKGSAGTSYSGGTGGGGWSLKRIDPSRVEPALAKAEDGQSNGAKGGNASARNTISGGGQGNPSGTSTNESLFTTQQQNGTGGLLIIYCDNLYNIGNINADGVTAKYSDSQIDCTGGSSGGGSLNIFCNKLYNGINKGTITSNGGAPQTRNTVYHGGAGGNGCVTIDAIKTYSEDNYDESIYNDNEYVEIPEIIAEEQEFNSKYITHNFLYNGHNSQSFTFEPDTEYTIECWGARGGSDDGDDYPSIIKGSYGNYICAKYITSVSITADIIVGESGSPGGGGWPDGASSVSEWGVNDPKRFCNKPTAGGSTTLNINNVKAITAKGGNGGTAQLVGTSGNHRITLDMSLVNNSVKDTLTCNCEINGHSGKFYNVLQKEWKSILIFCSQPSSSTGNHDRITFTWNALTDSSFMEFRIVRPTNQTNRLPELYDAYIYGAGPSGSIWMDCATSTMYAIQIKTSMLASFECSLLDSWGVEYSYPLFYFGSNLTSNDIVENHLVPSYRVLNEGFGAAGPVNSTSADYISSDIERINVSKTIPYIAGYHGMVRISELSKEYIYTSDNDDTIEFTDKQEKLILIPDKLGNRYINTKFLLECHGAASIDEDKGYKIQGIININNPTTLFCNVGEKGKGNAISYNNVKEFYSYIRGQYITPESYGGNTCISISNNQTNKKTVLINANGNGYFNNNINVSGYKCTGPRYTITYKSITATSTIGRIYASSYDDYSTGPCVLIINAQSAGTIRLKVENITTGSPRGGILDSNNNRLTGNYYSVDVNTSASKNSIYKITVGTAYSDGVIECKFIITYPTSNTYIRTGIRTDGINTGLLTLVRDNLVQLLDNNNYINEYYYEPFLNTNSTLLDMINSYHDNKQYCTLTAVIRNNRVNFSIRDVTNSDVNNLLLVCTFNRDAGGTIYYSCTNLTKGTPRRRMRGEKTLPPNYPNNPDGSGLGNDTANTYSASGGSGGYYTVWVGSANGKPTSYDIQISCTSLGDVYIPVNGRMISVYELNRTTQLLSSNTIQKNSDLNNYVNPMLTDVSISESNRTGNGIIYIKKLPIENDDYILNPDTIKVTEMTDEHSIYPSK